MHQNVSGRRSPLLVLSLLLGALMVAACSGGNNNPDATLQPGNDQVEATATETATRPKSCDDLYSDVCDTAIAVDDALKTDTVSGFDIDSSAKEAFALVLGRDEDLRVTAIGCPFAAVALGCGPSFGVAVSSVIPGTDARSAKGLTYTLVFTRDASCDLSAIYTSGPPSGGPSALCKPDGAAGTPLLGEVKLITEEQHLNALVNGGLAQGGTFAGRPKGITDTHVRSEWVAYPDEPAQVVPDALKGVPLREMKLGQSVPLDRLLFIESGCWGCDGPTSGFHRVYRLGGQIVKEEMDLPDGGIRSLAVRPGTQEVILVTCDKDYCGGLGPGVNDMVSTVHRSLDGGVSWENVGTFDDYASVETFTATGFVVHVSSPTDDLALWTDAWHVVPGGQRVTRPAGAAPFTEPHVLADGTLAFDSTDGKQWLRQDGTVAYEVPLAVDDERVYDVEAMDGGHLISWSIERGPTDRIGYQVLWHEGKVVAAYVDHGTTLGTSVGQWLGDAQYIGNAFVSDKQLGLPNSGQSEYQRSVPAYVDLAAGVVNPIDTPFFESNYRMNRTYVLGTWHGDDLARVNTPGDCLNLRESGSTDAKVVTCLKHGTLVTVDQLGGTPPEGWVRVFGPAGQSGYMAEEFLER